MLSVAALTIVYLVVARLERAPALRFRSLPSPRPYLATDMAWYLLAILATAVSVFLFRPVLSQLAILGSLERGGPQTLGRLAAGEGVQPPSITRVVRALEEQRLVTRTTLAEDRRSARVELTAKARRLIENIRRQRTAWLAQRVEALEPTELADLERGIDAMELLLEART